MTAPLPQRPPQATPQHLHEPARPGNPWFDRALLLATLLTCAVALSPSVADPDLWGHVQYGRDALAQGLAATTTYSYTAEGYRWINHENLAELLLAAGMDGMGPVGMLIAKCLLGVGVIGLIMGLAFRRGLGMLAVCVVALLVAVNLTYFWSMRPQVFSCVYYALLLALLAFCFAGWEGRSQLPWFDRRGDADGQLPYSSRRMRCLWLAVPLFFLWANSHGGFVAGYCIFVAYLVCRAVEVIVRRGPAGAGIVRRLAMMAVAAGLATLVNPYGPWLHAWLIQSLGVPRPEIVEWHPPDLASTVMIPLWLILFSWCAVLLLTRRSRDFTQVVLMTLILWQALSHVRHIPFFAIAFGFWMAPHVDSVLRRFNVGRNTSSLGQALPAKIKWSLAAAMGLAFALLAYKLYDRLHEMPVPRDQYPVAACQFLADHQVEGRLVVTYNWAQYAIAAFGPRGGDAGGLRVSFDGRFRTCYPQEVVDMNFDFVLGDLEPRFRGPASPPPDDQRVLEFGQPDLVLINRRQPHSVNVMFRSQDRWALLYQDSIAQVWGRRARYADPHSPDFIPPARRAISDAAQQGHATWPALPARGRRDVQLARGTTR